MTFFPLLSPLLATAVSDAVSQISSGPLVIAVLVAVAAGLVSFASPCVVPLLPGYLGYLSGMVGTTTTAGRPRAGHKGGRQAVATRQRGRLLAGVALFILGFSLVFVLLGVMFSAVGMALLRWQDVILRVAGVVVILLGLSFAGIAPFLQRDRRLTMAPRAGLLGAPILGFTFGLGWTPCIGPTLAAVLTLAFGGADPGRGALLAAAYCLGLGIPFVVVALLLDKSTRVIGWLGRHMRTMQIAGGILLVLVGLALVSGLWSEFMTRFQLQIADFETLL